ncbi:MAG: hypothetical protein QM817_15690 [Archangium sp.]
MLKTSSAFVAAFALGLVLASCSPAQTCSSATCGGCCSSIGKCESGTAADACGSNGLTCGRCGSGTVCMSGECRAGNTGGGGGTGGGTTGGGTTGGGTTGGGTTGGGGATGGGTTGGGGATGGGGTTGGGSGCRTVPTVAIDNSMLIRAEYLRFNNGNGHYNVMEWNVMPIGTNSDIFRLEIVYPNDQGPMPPVTQSFTSQGYFQCPICAIYQENCTSMGGCEHTYLAQTGSATINRADRATAGRVTGSLSNVRMKEWDLNSDTAVPGGQCVILSSVGPIDVGWNADGGMPPP